MPVSVWRWEAKHFGDGLKFVNIQTEYDIELALHST